MRGRVSNNTRKAAPGLEGPGGKQRRRRTLNHVGNSLAGEVEHGLDIKEVRRENHLKQLGLVDVDKLGVKAGDGLVALLLLLLLGEGLVVLVLLAEGNDLQRLWSASRKRQKTLKHSPSPKSRPSRWAAE